MAGKILAKKFRKKLKLYGAKGLTIGMYFVCVFIISSKVMCIHTVKNIT